MISRSKEMLIMLYERLYEQLSKNKKLKSKSVLISLMNLKSNRRLDILLASAIDGNTPFSDAIDQELIKEGYIIPVSDGENKKYILSGRGIWSVEKERISEDILIDYIDKKFFSIYGKKPKLSDREKIIILSFISLGAFSDQQMIDLKTNDLTKDKIKDVLNNNLKFLQQHGIISATFSENDIYGKPGNEHPVSHAIRHTDALPKKTTGIYKVIAPQKYYLDVYDTRKEKFQIDKLAYLYKLVFGNKLIDILEDFVQFVADTYSEYSIYVFKNTIHSTVDIKECLQDAFHEYVLKKDVL